MGILRWPVQVKRVVSSNDDSSDTVVLPDLRADRGLFRARRIRLGRGCALPDPCEERDRARVYPPQHRPCVGWQRGLAAHSGRCVVRGVSCSIRHDVLGFLPRGDARALRAYRARRIARVSRPRRQLVARVGRVLRRGIVLAGASARGCRGQCVRGYSHGGERGLLGCPASGTYHPVHAACGASRFCDVPDSGMFVDCA